MIKKREIIEKPYRLLIIYRENLLEKIVIIC